MAWPPLHPGCTDIIQGTDFCRSPFLCADSIHGDSQVILPKTTKIQKNLQGAGGRPTESQCPRTLTTRAPISEEQRSLVSAEA